jgi:polar amino acid transport system substrate-binding protein
MEEETRRQQEQLVQTEKMAALGILVSGVAHEINNPNNFIMLNAPILSDAWKSIVPILDDYFKQNGDFLVSGIYYTKMQSHIPELFNCILAGATRIKNIVQELRDFARESDARQMEWIDVNAVVRSSLTLMENMIKKSTDRFSVEYADPLPKIKGNFQRLEQVVINLIQNACQSLEGKERGILVTTMHHKAEKKVILKVIDQGRGIPPEISKYIMNPFFTTKRESGGVGLGLSISSKIVNEHKGSLKISSFPGKETTAVVEIPAMEIFDSSEGGGL